MNKSQAMKEASRRWGKQGAIRDVGRAKSCTAEERAAARDALMELRAFIVTPEDRKFFKPFREQLLSTALRERFTVGEIGSGAGFQWFSVRGTGDSWEEAFAKADRR